VKTRILKVARTAGRRRTQARKEPAQDRSRATVDAILEAAAYILAEEGWEQLTTNRIATRAGVNIGSLYQYFPNKEAIVHELQRRFRAEVHAKAADAMDAARPSPGGTPLGEAIRRGVESALAAIAPNPELHRAFLEELPRSARHVEPIDPRLVAAWKDAAAPLMVGVPDPEIAFFVWDAVMDGVVRAVCSRRPELARDPRLAEEVTVLLERFLIRSRS
jgi:AcrR family transcriptional regulator